MQRSTKEKYLEHAKVELRKKLAERGIILVNLDSFDKLLMDIGETYYRLKRPEDLF